MAALIKFLLFFILLVLVAWSSHSLTVKFYTNTLNDEIVNLNKKLKTRMIEIDDIVDELSEIENLVGVEYSDGEDLAIIDRLEYIKNKASAKIKRERVSLDTSFPSGKPLTKIYVTSKYGPRIHPISKRRRFHSGVDLRAKVGTKVYATSSGVVYRTGYEKKGYGKFIEIQHNMGFTTKFAHLNKILVKSGTVVKKGDIIALSGNTGRSNGPHLHYETRFGGGSISPIIDK